MRDKGKGTGWVQRQFAKLFVSGSIPALASIFPICIPIFPGYKDGRYLGGLIWERGSTLTNGAFVSGIYQEMFNRFNAQDRYKAPDYRRLESLMMEHHRGRIKAETEAMRLREKTITLSKQLSKIKRGAKP